jgi:hypothetical protein
MSIDYARWRTGLTVRYLPGHYRDNPYATWRLWRNGQYVTSRARPWAAVSPYVGLSRELAKKRALDAMRAAAAVLMATPTVSVITPTADQLIGWVLCERWFRRQTFRDVQWIVVDDGDVPITPTCGQVYIRRRREAGCTGAQSLARNILEALPSIESPIVAIVEHDDWYAPDHLARLVALLETGGLIAGDDEQRYYHVPSRRWRVFQNKGASLCQTAFRAELLPIVESVVRERLEENHYGIDGLLWATVPREQWRIERAHTVVGIKGLPGRRPGLGIGHRHYHAWALDAAGARLREWVGADADVYLTLHARAA